MRLFVDEADGQGHAYMASLCIKLYNTAFRFLHLPCFLSGVCFTPRFLLGLLASVFSSTMYRSELGRYVKQAWALFSNSVHHSVHHGTLCQHMHGFASYKCNATNFNCIQAFMRHPVA